MKKHQSLKVKVLLLFLSSFLIVMIFFSIFIFLAVRYFNNTESRNIVNYLKYLDDVQSRNFNDLVTYFKYSSDLFGGENTDFNMLHKHLSERGSLVFFTVERDDLVTYKHGELFDYGGDYDFFTIESDLQYKEYFYENSYYLILRRVVYDSAFYVCYKIDDKFVAGGSLYNPIIIDNDIIITNKYGNLLFNSGIESTRFNYHNRDVSKEEFIFKILSGEEGVIRASIGGYRYYVGSIFNEVTDWVIMVLVREDLLLSKLTRVILPVFLIINLIMIIFLVSGILFYKIVLKPVSSLRDLIVGFSEDKPVEISNRRSDEIGDVISAFGEMVNARKKLEGELVTISDEERRRIGNDLHDDLGQVLTGISFYLMSIDENLSLENKQIISSVKELVELSIKKTKLIARGISQFNLVGEDFPLAVRDFITNLQSVYDKKITFNFENNDLLNDNMIALNLYNIIIESINNAVKHGNCRSIIVNIVDIGNRGIRVEILDDGVGFDIGERGGGMGLRIMRYRAGVINGELLIESILGQGTRVLCSII